MRKFLIGFVSLGAVLAVYLLYSRVSKTPPIDAGPEAEFIESADSNMVGLNGEIGKVGDVGIGPVRKARYFKRDKNKRVVQEFGFEKLLHEVGDVFEVEKPYMNEYRRNFKCYITADRGDMQVETAVGRTTIKDATFTSNVVVHILPEGSGSFKESFVYLDNIVFLSERSQLSSAGPVRFISEDMQMRGTGLELIYDEQTGRLEFFRIIDLESLRIKSSQAAFFSTGKKKPLSRAEAHQPQQPAIAGDTQKAETLPIVTQPQVEQQQGEYYKCIFSKNVLIDAPEQLVFGEEKVCINDIFWSKTSNGRSVEVDAGSTDDIKTVAATAEQDRQSADSAGEQSVAASKPGEPNESSEQFVDIVVTCDNGIVLVPMDSTRAIDNFTGAGIGSDASDKELPAKLDDDTGRTKFFARRIDYNAATGDVIANGFPELTFYTSDVTGAEANEPVPIKVAARQTAHYFKASNRAVFTGDCLCTMPQSGLTEQRNVTFWSPEITVNLPEDASGQPDIFAAGPAELKFHVEDSNDTDAKKEPIPVIVNAKKQARFLAESNQIVFEGDCRCTMLREDPNVLVKYVLMSEQITVDLADDANDRSSEIAAGIKHLTAGGGVVTLATTKTAKDERALATEVQDANSERLLGGVELKCHKFDYDAAQQTFIATGPGLIKLFNSGGSEPNEQMGRFSLRKPGWAVLRDFDTLKYFLQENRIVADAGSQKLLIDYFSVVNGQHDEHVTAEASHVEAFLYEAAEGQTELSALTATGGIDYEDKRRNHFIGSELFYDHEKSIVQVKGDESQPCYYNGALVDEIKYDLKTGVVEAKVVGPGALQKNP